MGVIVIGAVHAMTDGVQTLRANHGARLRIAASLTIAECVLPRWPLAFGVPTPMCKWSPR